MRRDRFPTTGSDLDTHLLIEQKVITKDADYGSEVITYKELATVWGQAVDMIRPKEENTSSGLRLLNKPCEVTIRYREGMSTDTRITILRNRRVLQVVSIAEVGRQKYLTMMCEEFSV